MTCYRSGKDLCSPLENRNHRTESCNREFIFVEFSYLLVVYKKVILFIVV